MKTTNNLPNPLLRSEVFQVVIGSAQGNEIPMGAIINLQNAARIFRIEAYNDTQVSHSPEGLQVVDAATLNKSFLTLVDTNSTDIRNFPLSQVSKNVNGTTIEPVNTGRIDPSKCIIKIATGQVPPVGKVFLFLITYEKGQR